MATAKSPAPQGAFSRLDGKLKFRYLGIGFVWAWVYGSFETFAVYPDRTGIGINADASWVVSATVVVITLFALGFALGRKDRTPAPWVGCATAAAAGIGTLLSGLSFPGVSPLLIALRGVLTGLGTGVLYVLWGQALARLDIDTAELAIPAASLIMLVCALVLPYLPNFIGTLATASLPVASGIMLLLTYQDVEPSNLRAALEATIEKRGSGVSASSYAQTLAEIEGSSVMAERWRSYGLSNSYASSIAWADAVGSIRLLCDACWQGSGKSD